MAIAESSREPGFGEDNVRSLLGKVGDTSEL